MDLRSLTVFDAIYRTGSVSRAGEQLDLPQSSVSLTLARLRAHFDDPLFVRTSDGMKPTPHAAALIAHVREAVELLRRIGQRQARFEPAAARRKFVVCMSGITHVVLLPALMERLAAVAPGVRVEVLPISLESAHLLETGLADLAVGFVPELEAGFYQQRLFEQRFVCVVRSRHPRLRSRMTAAAYQREKHLVVTSPGAGEELVVRALEAAGLEREVVLQLPNFLGIGALVSQTDLVITLPIRVAQTLVQISQVKLLDPPFASPTFAVKQHWHERFHQDAANRWLRSVISELFLDVQGAK